MSYGNSDSLANAGASELAERTLRYRQEEVAQHWRWQEENKRLHRERMQAMEAERQKRNREREEVDRAALVDRLRERWRHSGAGTEAEFQRRLPDLIRQEQDRLLSRPHEDRVKAELARSGAYDF